MATMDELKKHMEKCVAYYRNRVSPELVQSEAETIAELMLESGDVTLRFLEACTQEEYELCALGFLNCAYKWGMPFVVHLENLADQKGWTDILTDMIGEARAEVE